MGETGPSANPFEPPTAALEQKRTRPPGEMGPVARFFGVFTSPGKTFASIARFPGRDWLFPVGLAVVISLTFGLVASSKVDVDQAVAKAMEQVEKRGDIPEEQRVQIEEMQRKGMEFFAKKMLPIFTAVAPILIVLIVSGLWHGIAAAFGVKTTYRRALTGAAYAQSINILKGAVALPIMLSRPTLDLEQMGSIVKSNVGAFLSADASPVFRALATTWDVFDFWTLVVSVIAVSHVTRFKTAGAVAVVLTLWFLYVCFAVGGAAFGVAMGGG